jgi:hypothetical protein
MFSRDAVRIDNCDDGGSLDAALEELPAGAGVYLIAAVDGRPHIGRTSMVRRRLKRLLRERSATSRLLTLRNVVRTIEYWQTGSTLESSLIFYELARTHFGDRYLDLIKLRYPSFVKLVLSNMFPRTQITTRIGGGQSRYYGPFRSRALAEEFEHQVLDLFQLRRCQEDLVPSAEHPGCIYGEMNMCLRPCQEVVSTGEYGSEAHRVAEFLATQGKQLLHATEHARDRLSEELDFEGAAREHKRVERIEAALKARDDLACDIASLNGVAVTRSIHADVVSLWIMLGGIWQPVRELDVGMHGDEPLSLDHRVRDVIRTAAQSPAQSRDRQDHIALLVRWYFSSWRDGEWIGITDLEKLPIRRLVGGVSRVAAKSAAGRTV